MPPTANVVLRVDPATARAYRDASDEGKARARSAFESALAEEREGARRQAAEEMIRYTDEVGRRAEARGLTPAILDDILHDRAPRKREIVGAPAGPDEHPAPWGAAPLRP